MKNPAFDRFAAISAILAGIAILLYAIAFLVIARSAPELGAKLSSLCLLLNGLLITAPLIALCRRLEESGNAFALWALILGMGGALGAAVHGGYDLANAINPPAGITPELSAALATLPNQLDPRGLLTFGVSSIAIFIFARLMGESNGFGGSLKYVGYLLAVLLLWLYLGRLVILDPTNPLLVAPILLTGFIVNPLWYFWLGITLQRQPNAVMQTSPATRMSISARR